MIALVNESASVFGHGASFTGDMRKDGLHVHTAPAKEGDTGCKFSLFMNGPGEQGKHDLDMEASPDCKKILFNGPVRCFKDTIQGQSSGGSGSTTKNRKAQCFPKCAKLHTYMDDQLFILIVRDPRDVIVSSFYFANASRKFDGPADMASKALAVRARRTSIYHYFYIDSDIAPHAMSVFYEDLRLDQHRELRRLAAALALPVTEEILHRVTEATSFERMREMEDQNQLVGIHRPNGGTLRKTRCGGVAQWTAWPASAQREAREILREEFTPRLIELYLDESRVAALQRIGRPEGALCDDPDADHRRVLSAPRPRSRQHS